MTDFLDRLERACSRAEYEFPRLAAPDGAVAVPFTDLRQLLASVGRNPEGQDRETGLGRNDEHAVGATSAETPNLGSTPETGLVEALAEARSALFYIFECSDDEQASRVAKKAFDKVGAALSNVLPDEV